MCITQDPAGAIYVGILDDILPGDRDAYVKRWNGSAWQQLGGRIGVNTNYDATSLSLVTLSDGTVFAALTSTLSITLGEVWEWTGTDWDFPNGDTSQALVAQALGMSGIAITSAPQGRAYVAYSIRKAGGTSQLVVQRLDRTGWSSLPDGPIRGGGTTGVLQPRAAVDASGNLIVTWQEMTLSHSNVYASFWDSAAYQWKSLGDALDVAADNDASAPSIVLTAQGIPIVAWFESDPQQGQGGCTPDACGVHVKKLNSLKVQ